MRETVRAAVTQRETCNKEGTLLATLSPNPVETTETRSRGHSSPFDVFVVDPIPYSTLQSKTMDTGGGETRCRRIDER